MAIEFQLQFVRPGKTATFTFKQTVLSQVAGITSVTWRYTTRVTPPFQDYHNVARMGVTLASNMSGSTVTVTPTFNIYDDSGNTQEDAYSGIQIGMIAVTGQADPNIALATSDQIANDAQGSPIALPSATLDISETFLSGFDMTFGTKARAIHRVDLGAGLNLSGVTGTISAVADMQDTSGHRPQSATINAGLVAQVAGGGQLIAKVAPNLQTDRSVTIDMGQPIKEAIAFVQSGTGQLKGPACPLGYFQIGSSAPKVAGSSVILKLPGTEFDGQQVTVGPYGPILTELLQDNKKSSVTMVIFAKT